MEKHGSVKQDLICNTNSCLQLNFVTQPTEEPVTSADSAFCVALTKLRFLTRIEDTIPESYPEVAEREAMVLESGETKNEPQANNLQNSREDEALMGTLKPRDSQIIKKVLDGDGAGDEDPVENTNLQIDHVFVYMVIPPDGEYGWLICFVCFLCQVVIDGILFSIGLLLPFIAKDFDVPESKVVLVASLQVGFYFLSGAVACAFINKYGFRAMAMTGSLVAVAVLLISTYCGNLSVLLFFYSVVGGPSLSMIWVSSQLIIGYYFDKFRPIASGAASSGTGVGIMLFSYMNSVLVAPLGWRNLIRLHAVFLIVVLIMTLSFVEVTPTRIGKVKEVLAEDSVSESLDIVMALTEYSRYSLKVDEQEHSLQDGFEAILQKTDPATGKDSSSCCDQCLEKCCCWSRPREEKSQPDTAKHYVIKKDLIEKHDMFYAGPKDYEAEQQVTEEVVGKVSAASGSIEDERGHTISLEEMDNKYVKQTVIKNLSSVKPVRDRQERTKFHKTYSELKNTEKHPLLVLLLPQNWLHPKILKAFDILFDFGLLSVMEFRILLLSAFLFLMGLNIPLLYSTERVQIDASFARLITPTIGFSNFVFRIASGFVAFKYREQTTYICGGGMCCGGLAVFVSAFYGLDVVSFQFLYALCYGIAPAFYSTLRAIIYVRALGLDKLTNAFGLTALAMSLGVFIGTTAAGILNDVTGSYTAAFVFAGICICASGALKLLLPYFAKLLKDKESEKMNHTQAGTSTEMKSNQMK